MTPDAPAAPAPMRLTVGPALFHWGPERWVDFYARLADEAPVDRVVVGEVVCSKRAPFYEDLIEGVVERLRRGGKEVVLATLGLLTSKRERNGAAGICGLGLAPVEINDLTALAWAQAPFDVGPLVNVYNEGTLAFLGARGARSVCLPPELPFASVRALAQAGAGCGVDVEVWAYGRVPLAISARCYHARLHALTKDSCQFVCGQDPDGLKVTTLEGQAFLAVNGVQTLSFNYAGLVGDVDALAAAGVHGLRLSPHGGDFVGVTRVFRERLDDRLDDAAALERLAALTPDAPLSHGFLFGPAGATPLRNEAAPAL